MILITLGVQVSAGCFRRRCRNLFFFSTVTSAESIFRGCVALGASLTVEERCFDLRARHERQPPSVTAVITVGAEVEARSIKGWLSQCARRQLSRLELTLHPGGRVKRLLLFFIFNSLKLLKYTEELRRSGRQYVLCSSQWRRYKL